jgi:hypothetical protein
LHQSITQQSAQFRPIRRRPDSQIRKQPEHPHFLTGMMGGAEIGVGKPRAGAHHSNREVVITQIHPDLLHAAISDKGSDGVTERTQTTLRQPCCHTNHIGLCYAAVIKTIGKLCFEFVEKPVANIRGKQHNPGINPSERKKFVSESISHVSPSSL